MMHVKSYIGMIWEMYFGGKLRNVTMMVIRLILLKSSPITLTFINGMM